MPELVQDPGVETGVGWTFVADGDGTAVRDNSDPYQGTWHGQVRRFADAGVIGGFRNGSAIATFFGAPVGSVVTPTLYVKRTGGTDGQIQYDPGTGSFTLLALVSLTGSYTLWEPGSFVLTGPGPGRLRIRPANGTSGLFRFDEVHADSLPPRTMYPKGPPRFQPFYTDDVTGLPVIESLAIRDIDGRIRDIDDEDLLGADDLRRMWPAPRELRDDLP